MLLAIDAGNSYTGFGVFREGELLLSWKTPSGGLNDAAGVREAVKRGPGGSVWEPGECVISSVVPRLTAPLAGAAGELCRGRSPLVVSRDTETGLEIRYRGEPFLGSDRMAAAAACAKFYPGENVVIIDAGTATTLGVLEPGGVFVGGIIAPGLGMSARAMSGGAALLPEVGITLPPKAVCDNAAGSMQSGIVYGAAELIDGLVRRIIRERGFAAARVVATGGWSGLLSAAWKTVDVVDPDLVLRGLEVIHGLNRSGGSRARRPG